MRLIDSTAAVAGDASDTRIISATAQVAPLTSAAFDARLFYRLNTIHIVLDDESRLTSYTVH